MTKYREALVKFAKCQMIADQGGYGPQWNRIQIDQSMDAFDRLERAMRVREWERGTKWYMSEAVQELRLSMRASLRAHGEQSDSYADGAIHALQCAMDSFYPEHEETEPVR